MEIYNLIILITIYGILGSYTKNYQFATISIGKAISKTDLEKGLQNAITPKIQTFRNITSFFLLITIFSYSLYLYTWYWALLITILAFFIVIRIFDFFIHNYDHPHYLDSIIKNMEKRINMLKKTGNKMELITADEVLKNLIEHKNNY